jgi:VWFA-related protein
MRLCLSAFVAAACIGSAWAQAPTYSAGSAEVLVDVVVRDRNGKLIKNLRQDEISVAEDGAPQKIIAFRTVRDGGVSQPASPDVTVQTRKPGESGAPALKVQRPIRLVSLVYERLQQTSRGLARQASLDFLENDLGENVYYAVFYIDRSFIPVLSYTNDKKRIREAIELVTSVQSTTLASDARILTAPQLAPMASSGGGSGTGAPDTAAIASAAVEQSLLATTTAAADYVRRSDSQLFGSISIFSMWGIISELGRLPGKKSVILFSEGLVLPGHLVGQYESMLSAANRANVTINTVDARGLIITSDQAFANRLLGNAADVTAGITGAPSTNALGVDNTNFPTGYGREELGFDYAMDSLKGNNQMNLIDLADRTGGMAITNTNDFRKPLKQLSEEFNTYYEVSYQSTDPTYDGKFRKIEVKVSRPGAAIQARDGYFALPTLNGEPVFPFEAPLLVALGQTPLKKDLEFRAGVIQYQQKDGTRQASLVFELPRQDIKFVPYEKEEGKSKTHVAVLALVKNEQGLVVAKLSRDLPLLGPTDKVEPYRKGRFIITRNVTLKPGRYTVESAAADFEANKVATKKSVLVVLESPAGPMLSEMALVRRLDKADDPRVPDDPLQLKENRVVPTLDSEITEAKNGVIKVFLVLYPDGTADKPRMAFDVLRDGQSVTRFQPETPAPNEDGVIPYFLNLPLEQLRPGQYEIRAGMVQGQKVVRRSLFVTIKPAS